MANKKPTYKPAAVDADGDGIVQEGTEFERPVDTELEVEVTDQVEIEDTASEALEATVEASTPVQGVSVYVASESDTYASVASQFLPAGMKKHDYATELYNKNRGATLTAGFEVKL